MGKTRLSMSSSFNDWKIAVGVVAALLGCYGAWSYIRSITSNVLEHEYRPHFWSWCVFSIGAVGGAIFTWRGGAGISGVILPVVLAVLVCSIFVLTWNEKYRHEGLERGFHRWTAVVAVAVYGLQFALGFPPLWAVLAAIAVDFGAVEIMLEKCWKDEGSEPVIPWVFGTLGGVVGIFALRSWNFTTLAFPIYFSVTNGSFVAILWYKQRAHDAGVDLGVQ